jgi:hypothetical protein
MLDSLFYVECIKDARGDIGPFQVAIALTLVCLILILFWEENTGFTTSSSSSKESNSDTPSYTESEASSFRTSALRSLTAIRTNPAVLLLGLSQAFYEGAVFTFGKYNLHIR